MHAERMHVHVARPPPTHLRLLSLNYDRRPICVSIQVTARDWSTRAAGCQPCLGLSATRGPSRPTNVARKVSSRSAAAMQRKSPCGGRWADHFAPRPAVPAERPYMAPEEEEGSESAAAGGYVPLWHRAAPQRRPWRADTWHMVLMHMRFAFPSLVQRRS